MRRKQTPSVSLFPFLAVLVCAMGALILLLLVTTQRIRSGVVQKARIAKVQSDPQFDVEPTLETPESLHTPTQIERPDSVTAEPPALTGPVNSSELAERNLIPMDLVEVEPSPRPAALESNLPSQPRTDPNAELNELVASLAFQQDRLKRLLNAQTDIVAARKRLLAEQNQKLQSASAQTTTVNQLRASAVSEMNRMAAEEESVKEQITKLRGKIQNATVSAAVETRFTIAPYDGRSGTTRRPILIECTGHGFRFVPEDVFIAESDLRGFSAEFNPLLVGARTLVNHWTTSKESEEPYVLLIVRPSGSLAFYSAKTLLRNLGQPFGYELLGEDVKLDEPEVDVIARSELDAAVRRAISEREQLQQTLQSDALVRQHEADSESNQPGRAMRIGRNGSVHIDERPSKRSGQLRADSPRPFDGRPRGGTFEGDSNSESVVESERPPGAIASSDRVNSLSQSGVGRTETTSSDRTASIAGRRFDGSVGRNAAQSHPRVFLKPVPNGEQTVPEANGSIGRRPNSSSPSRSSDSNADNHRTGNGKSDQRQGNTSDRRKTPGQSSVDPTDPGSVASDRHFPDFSADGSSSEAGSRRRATRSPQADYSPWSGSKRAWGVGGQSGSIGFERVVRITVDSKVVRVANYVIPLVDPNDRASLTARVLSGINNHAKTWGKPSRGFYWVPAIQFEVSPDGDEIHRQLSTALRSLGLTVERVAGSGSRGGR